MASRLYGRVKTIHHAPRYQGNNHYLAISSMLYRINRSMPRPANAKHGHRDSLHCERSRMGHQAHARNAQLGRMELMTLTMDRLAGKRHNLLPDMASRSIPRTIDNLQIRINEIEIAIEIIETCIKGSDSEYTELYTMMLADLNRYYTRLYDRYCTVWERSQ